MREAKAPIEGIIANLHIIRVAPKIGLIPESNDGIKSEKKMMQVLPKSIWEEIRMVIYFWTSAICRPQPKCLECHINGICGYYKEYY